MYLKFNMKNQIIGFIGFASCFTLDLHRFTFKFYFAPLGYLRVFFLFNTKGRNDIDTSYMCWLSLNGKKRLKYITVLFMSTQATFYFQSLHFAFQFLSISVFKEKYLINVIYTTMTFSKLFIFFYILTATSLPKMNQL